MCRTVYLLHNKDSSFKMHLSETRINFSTSQSDFPWDASKKKYHHIFYSYFYWNLHYSSFFPFITLQHNFSLEMQFTISHPLYSFIFFLSSIFPFCVLLFAPSSLLPLLLSSLGWFWFIFFFWSVFCHLNSSYKNNSHTSSETSQLLNTQ